MNWNRSLVLSAAVASCLTVFAAHATLASAAPAPGPAPHLTTGPGDYQITSSVAGGALKFSATVIAQYHINKAYPVKFNGAAVDASTVSYSGGTADLPSTVSVNIPGQTSGKVKFGYCSTDGSSCLFAEVPVGS